MIITRMNKLVHWFRRSRIDKESELANSKRNLLGVLMMKLENP